MTVVASKSSRTADDPRAAALAAVHDRAKDKGGSPGLKPVTTQSTPND